MQGQGPAAASEPSWKILLLSAVGCGVCTLLGIGFDRVESLHNLAHACYAAAFLLGGWDAAVDTYERLKRVTLDIHFLMLAVAVGAAAIGSWWEGGTLLFLFSLSNALEAMAQARTEREIRSLFNESPKTATVVAEDGSEHTVPTEALSPGQTIRILPDHQFPADAVVLRGRSAADESSLTGESDPVEKEPGDTVFSGTLNTYGPLLAEVLRPPGESAHARIIRLIREAQASKAPSQRFTDKFGTVYTVGLLGFTLLMFLMWHYVAGLPAFATVDGVRPAFYRAMTLLVVCSPCALVISIPSAVLTGIAAGARRGILFRGGIALENLATITRLAADKTGTLTKGELELTAIESSRPAAEDEVLRLAAALCRHSTHPVSRAVIAAWRRRQSAEPPEAHSLASLPGQGLQAETAGRKVLLGRRSLFPEHSWIQTLPDPPAGLTEMLLATDHLAGRILLRDAVRPESAALIGRLHAQGIRVTMLSGDRPEAAQLVARELHLDDVRAGLTPERKVAAIREWQAAGERVAMLGDGVNDAPSLAAADISIGMGLRGSDAVLEQADVVLTQDRLERVLEALTLSRRCRAVIRQNVAISLGVVVVLAASALGSWIPLPLGVLGHEGSTVIVVLNSLRLLWRS
ncbi:MAG: cadmium-translocating P-type ATPase [Akkermansiaceae bacterium]|nr:cadmium-translocating P-type ATPase [Akkermansiaceae bacterium]